MARTICPLERKEIEEFFEDEVRERAVIARSAGYMNRRRKMPNINNYTNAELQARNGPIRTYSTAQSEAAPRKD